MNLDCDGGFFVYVPMYLYMYVYMYADPSLLLGICCVKDR